MLYENLYSEIGKSKISLCIVGVLMAVSIISRSVRGEFGTAIQEGFMCLFMIIDFVCHICYFTKLLKKIEGSEPHSHKGLDDQFVTTQKKLMRVEVVLVLLVVAVWIIPFFLEHFLQNATLFAGAKSPWLIALLVVLIRHKPFHYRKDNN